MGKLKVVGQDGKVVEIGDVKVRDTEGISRDLLKSMDADENLFGLDWEGEIGTDDEGVYMMVRPVDGVFSLVVQ
jgi:hypothetical protein